MSELRVLGERAPREPLLQVEDLQVSYGAITALRGISLTLGKGEIVALIGANGAGKSSTLRAVSGMLRPKSGSIRLDDQEIAGRKAHTLIPLGMALAPEGRGIFLNLTVEENLQLGAYLRRDTAAIKADMEQCFGFFPVLKNRLQQLSGTLSGGEQQMLAITAPMGRAADEPEVLFQPYELLELFPLLARAKRRCDEPALGLYEDAHDRRSVGLLQGLLLRRVLLGRLHLDQPRDLRQAGEQPVLSPPRARDGAPGPKEEAGTERTGPR